MRIKRLDGIRAIAIGLVFLDHAFAFKAGWIGVDIFFVLSGFLITGILRRDRYSNAFWSRFYIRRATRILPPLLLCFAGTALLLVIPWQKLWAYYLFFAANVAEALYPKQGQTLGVLWSLAVEEHYYLMWPFAVRFLDRPQLCRLLVAVLCIEPILRAAATPFASSSWLIYLLTPFRLDGLAAGSLLAILLERDETATLISKWAGLLFPASVILLTALLVTGHFDITLNSIWFNIVGYSLTAFAGVSFIAYVVLQGSSGLSRLLERPVFVFIGEISYGLYLFHGLALVIVARFSESVAFHHFRTLMPLTIALAVGFSWASHVFYERPLIRWGRALTERAGAGLTAKDPIATSAD